MTDDEILAMAKSMWFAIIRQPTSPTEVEIYSAPHSAQATIAFARAVAARQRGIDAGICDMYADFTYRAAEICAEDIRGQE